MKKYIQYILLAGWAVTAAACQHDAETWDGETGSLRLNIQYGQTTRAYNPAETSTMRIYQMVEGEEKLIRKYSPITEMPEDLYLVAGNYKAKVVAGDQSQATFTNLSYAAEQPFEIRPNSVSDVTITCLPTNVAVKVNYDQTILDKMDLSFQTLVCASDAFQADGSVPTLTYTESKQGYFLLPEGVTDMSWRFEAKSSTLGEVIKSGVIHAPRSGYCYSLNFKYSKTPNGSLGIEVWVEDEGEIHNDNFIFSPQPTFSGNGFGLNSVVGYYTEDILINIASVQPLQSIAVTANGTDYPIMTGGNPAASAATNGISYSATNETSGTITFGADFFAKFPTGIHELQLTALDVDNGEGKATARVAIAGLTPLTTSDYDLWFNTGNFRAIVTNPSVSDVKIRYRSRTTGTNAFGEWKTVTATKVADFTYTAQATDFAASSDYEYELLLGGTASGSPLSLTTEAGAQLTNGDMEQWLVYDSMNFPCWSGEVTGNGMGSNYTGFWGTGNPGSKMANFNITGPSTDVRPGSSGTKSALLETKSYIGVKAAGNLFLGTFVEIHKITKGKVDMGRPFSFNARPKALKFWVKGTVGSSDKLRVFLIMGKLSGPHRVDTADTSTFIDLSAESLSTGPIYATADWLQETSIGEWTEVTLQINYREDHLNECPNYLLITATSSYRGDYMEGSTDSKMYIDDVEFVY